MVMARIKVWWLAGALIWAGTTLVVAQEIVMDVQPRVLRLGEAATMSIRIENGKDPKAPQFLDQADLKITPMGQERSFAFGTGGRSSSVTFNYRLLPMKAGTFQVGPYKIAADDREVDVGPVELTVYPPGEPARATEKAARSIDDLLFARIEISRTNVYYHQYFDIVLKIYSRNVQLGREISLLNMPESGFKHDLRHYQEMAPAREVIANEFYDVRAFRGKMQALAPGEFTFQPVLRVGVVVPRARARASRGLFDDPFFDNFFNAPNIQGVDLRMDPVQVRVLPLPAEGRPAGYNGAVGRFEMEVEARPLDGLAGDPITVSITLRGVEDSNIDAVTAPRFEETPELKVYEAKLLKKEINEAVASGVKVFEQVLIPRTDKMTALPPLEFSYFDPMRESYVTVRRGPFPLQLKPAAVAPVLVQATPDGSAPTEVLGVDIVYLKQAPSNWRKTGDYQWYRRPGFLWAQVTPVLVLLGMWAMALYRRKYAGDIVRLRRRQAPKVARAALRQAEAALRHGERKAFFDALWLAIAAYFGRRLNLTPGAVTGAGVVDAIRRTGMRDDLAGELSAVLDICDAERFAGGGTDAFNREFAGRIGRLLQACEKVRL